MHRNPRDPLPTTQSAHGRDKERQGALRLNTHCRLAALEKVKGIEVQHSVMKITAQIARQL
jgi:hypothetical protein